MKNKLSHSLNSQQMAMYPKLAATVKDRKDGTCCSVLRLKISVYGLNAGNVFMQLMYHGDDLQFLCSNPRTIAAEHEHLQETVLRKNTIYTGKKVSTKFKI